MDATGRLRRSFAGAEAACQQPFRLLLDVLDQMVPSNVTVCGFEAVVVGSHAKVELSEHNKNGAGLTRTCACRSHWQEAVN